MKARSAPSVSDRAETLGGQPSGHADFGPVVKRCGRLDDPNVVLSSFIVSNTPAFRMEQQWRISKVEMDGLNVLFQDNDKDTCIGTMLSRARSAVV